MTKVTALVYYGGLPGFRHLELGRKVVVCQVSQTDDHPDTEGNNRPSFYRDAASLQDGSNVSNHHFCDTELERKGEPNTQLPSEQHLVQRVNAKKHAAVARHNSKTDRKKTKKYLYRSFSKNSDPARSTVVQVNDQSATQGRAAVAARISEGFVTTICLHFL